MELNQLIIVVISSEVEEEIKLSEVEMIPELGEELGCYHLVSISQHLLRRMG